MGPLSYERTQMRQLQNLRQGSGTCDRILWMRSEKRRMICSVLRAGLAIKPG
jgi:hypothetical protein